MRIIFIFYSTEYINNQSYSDSYRWFLAVLKLYRSPTEELCIKIYVKKKVKVEF